MASDKNSSGAEIGLAGLGIMVTRAQHQAEPLCRKIEDVGGRAIRLPVLEIRAVEPSSQLDALIDRLSEFDLAIFVSANAVRHALARIRSRNATVEKLSVAAVGLKTAQALEAAGHRADICPSQGFTSEDLLKLGELQSVHGRRIAIFRGEGGRELLAETLTARGARVEYAEVYGRAAPRINHRTLEQTFNDGSIDLVTLSTAEGLKNLLAMVGIKHAARLRQVPLLVGSQRMRQVAYDMGFITVITARDPTDEAMFEGILQWSRQHPKARH